MEEKGYRRRLEYGIRELRTHHPDWNQRKIVRAVSVTLPNVSPLSKLCTHKHTHKCTHAHTHTHTHTHTISEFKKSFYSFLIQTSWLNLKQNLYIWDPIYLYTYGIVSTKRNLMQYYNIFQRGHQS